MKRWLLRNENRDVECGEEIFFSSTFKKEVRRKGMRKGMGIVGIANKEFRR